MRLDHITPKQFGCGSQRLLASATDPPTNFPELGPGREKGKESLLFNRRSARPTRLPGGHSESEPPDPIPNSEVKRLSADDSVGLPHVKVGHCQALNTQTPIVIRWGLLFRVGRQ